MPSDTTPPPDLPSPDLPPPGAELNEKQARALAVHCDPAVRAGLAARAEAAPELLFYMADDDDPAVRRAVAANPTTPIRACGRLARDRDADVRALLAGKLARALPHLTAMEQAALKDLAHNALEMLAADQVVRVRAALAGALKDVAVAPPALVARLARDVAREVAEPVLRACATLSDEDLVSILAAQPVPWVIEAIARRPALGPAVTDAVLATGDAAAADILRLKAGEGEDQPPTGTDLAVAPQATAKVPLPAGLTQRLDAVIADGVQAELAAEGFDRESREAVAAVTRRRLDWARDYVASEPPERRAVRLAQTGELGEDAVWDALSWGDMPFARAALALLARVPPDVPGRVLDTKGPRAITALAWRAGLSMRCARALQAKAGVPNAKLLNARHGTDFPLSEEQMRWQLSLFGVED